MTQLQMIEKTKSLAEKDERVSSLFMYGSFTKGEGDQYSDIEFYVFLKDEEKFVRRSWVSQIDPVAIYFTNEYGSDVAIFENMVRGEFHFLTTIKVGVINSWDGLIEFSDFDKMALVDKEQRLANAFRKIRTKTPIAQQARIFYG